MKLIVLCCVCGKEKITEYLWEMPKEQVDKATCSHGLCPKCLKSELAKLDELLV